MANRFAILLPILVFTAACSTSNKSSGQPEVAGRGWVESMQSLSQILSELLPRLSNPDIARGEQDRSEILGLSKKLASRAHQVDGNKSAPSRDPALKFISQNLKTEVDRAIQAMELGRWEQGQRQMLGVSRNCIACHTLQLGPMNSPLPNLHPDLDRFTDLQKADYYAAVRQFDLAINHYEKVLANPAWAKSNPSNWNEAFQRLLAISVRVNGDPSLTMELISRFIDSGSYPTDLQAFARIWRKNAKDWRDESSVPISRKAGARKLFEKAEALASEKGSKAGFLMYLRVSALVHSQLAGAQPGRDPEMLYLAGQSAERLASLNFWSFPEDYYRVCSQIKSQSPWVKKCQTRLQSFAVQGAGS